MGKGDRGRGEGGVEEDVTLAEGTSLSDEGSVLQVVSTVDALADV